MTQLPGELTVADIHGDDMGRAALEQTVGKTTR
jgi:hypothetical protein